MAFKLVEDDSYSWPVEVQIPRDGKHVKNSFKARFKYLEQDRIDGIVQSGGDEDLLDEILTGWEGFKDAAGQAIEYSEENRAQALRTPFVRVALVNAFFGSLTGKQARRKN